MKTGPVLKRICAFALTAVLPAVSILLFSGGTGGRLALAVGMPGFAAGKFAGETWARLLMPNFVPAPSGQLFRAGFWESFFGETPVSAAALLETLSADEIFSPQEGEGLHEVVRTDLHPASAGGMSEYNGTYFRNKSRVSFEAGEIVGNGIIEDFIDPAPGPLVLVFHTHSRECYNDTGDTFSDPEITHISDPQKSVVAVGDMLCRALEGLGISCIHLTDEFDSAYSGAYARSDAAVGKVLEQYPSIKVVLDIHRDAVYTANGDKLRPVTQKDGQDVAQVMLITGTAGSGDDANPHWEKNVRFSLLLQQALEARCPGITRAMSVFDSSYNQYRANEAALIEVGTTGNTLTEAKRSACYIALALSDLIAQAGRGG